MAVKAKNRHQARNDCLSKCRIVMHQSLILTRPPIYNAKGKLVRRAGKLGVGQPFQIFGVDIVRCIKTAHGACYEASKIHLRDKETLTQRITLHEKAIEQLRSILRQLDFCIFEYGTSKDKRKSFNYMGKITNEAISSIYDRINRDNLIYKQKYQQ